MSKEVSKTRLVCESLSKESFEQFGDVIELEGAEQIVINQGNVLRYHDLARVDIDFANGGRPLVSVFEVTTPASFPYSVRVLERHPIGSQAFVPLGEYPFVLVVAPPGDEIDLQRARAFVSNGRQGVNYAAGTWHMPLISEVVGRRFLIVDRGGPGDNCDEVMFEDGEIELNLDARAA